MYYLIAIIKSQMENNLFYVSLIDKQETREVVSLAKKLNLTVEFQIKADNVRHKC